MTGLLDWLKSLYTVGVQYICWLGLATLVFSHSLEKRKIETAGEKVLVNSTKNVAF